MFSLYDIFTITLICILVNCVQPIVNELLLNIFKKLAGKIIAKLLKYASRELPIKKIKPKNNSQSEVFQAKAINSIQENLPTIVDTFQKKGLDGLLNLASTKISTILNVKTASVETNPTPNTVQVEDITEEAKELQQYRLSKVAKD